MEFLKIKLQIATLLITAMAWIPQVEGQGFKTIENAFKQSYELETKGNYSDAVAQLKSVYDEDSYAINLRLGWLYYMQGSFTESSAHYQRAVALSPYAIEGRLGYVYPLAALGNWAAVRTQYEKILQIDPNNTTASYRLGMILYSSENYQQALKLFEKVANLYPFDYDANVMYAWTSLKLGKLREAEVLFRKVLLIRPGDSSAMEGLQLVK
jgi:tetratricopeptide (TPR) repeat protein